jgi:hypothetical protein
MSGKMRAQDAIPINYLVVVIHTEYEQCVYGFVHEAAARLEYENHKGKCEERFLVKVMEQGV